MSNIFSVKYMNEASASLSDKVFKTPVKETYLYSTLRALTEMNKEINEATKTLYIHIAEAESKEDENKIFSEYFYQFKNTFQNFRNKVEEMKSRLIINVENKVDVWKDVFKDDNCGNFENEFTYSGHKFYHLDDACYPRFNLYKLYQKEFDYIGRLMQDNASQASPGTKLKIIASVSNNFINYTANKDWIKGMIKDMVDVDNKEINGSYSESIYNSLKDKYDIRVDKAVLYTCRENLCDYEDIINANIKMCDDLLRDLDKVGENISSYLFRNQDKKLKIKTETDGVIDRDYRLDTYSMNELDLFLKNKVNQVKKVLNIYAIAIGIKFDTIVEYIDQNIDILRTAMMNEEDDHEEEDSSSYAGDQFDDNEDTGKDYTSGDVGGSSDDDFEFGGENDDDFEDDDFEFADNDMGDEFDEPIEEEPEDVSFEDEEEPESKEEEPDSVDGGSGEFEEAYLFPSQVFEMELMFESYQLYEDIRNLVLLEAETIESLEKKIKDAESDKADYQKKLNQAKIDKKDATTIAGLDSQVKNKEADITRFKQQLNDLKKSAAEAEEKAKKEAEEKSKAEADAKAKADGTYKKEDQPATSNQNLKALANREKDTLWRRIMTKLAELWKKFKDKVFGNKTKEKSDYLKRNEKYIGYTFPITDPISMKYTPNFTNLFKIKIPDLDYTAMAQYLNDRDDFEKQYFPDFVKDGGDLIENMKDMVLGEEQNDITDLSKLIPSIKDAFDFCKDYPSKVSNLQRQSEVLDRAQRAARDDIGNVKESALNNGYEQYFTEFDGGSGKDDEDAKTKKTNVSVYFQVCSQVLTAEMNIYEQLYNELYKYCTWYIGKAKTVGKAPGEATETPKDQQGEQQTQQNQQQNQNAGQMNP